jgi:hypothetical protein
MKNSEERNNCGTRWLEGAEVFCQLEPHAAEHWSKVQIEYGNGIVSAAEIWWVSDANLRSQNEKESG